MDTPTHAHRDGLSGGAPQVGRPAKEWVDIRRDHAHGIESIYAHFEGHAYDSHDHDEMLVGVTLQGVQRFHCGRALHVSTPGKSMLIEPGATHDGHAPDEDGFTYAMLYLPQAWLDAMTQQLGLPAMSRFSAFRHTLNEDARLGTAIHQAFLAVHRKEGRLVQDQCLDRLLAMLAGQRDGAARARMPGPSPQLERVRDMLHTCMSGDVGLEELAACSGMDRFRLSRQFMQAFGRTPHAYLVQLRLRAARRLLAGGADPARAAIDVGFSDQSHLGRWFRRAYRMTPAAYRRACTNVLD